MDPTLLPATMRGSSFCSRSAFTTPCKPDSCCQLLVPKSANPPPPQSCNHHHAQQERCILECPCNLSMPMVRVQHSCGAAGKEKGNPQSSMPPCKARMVHPLSCYAPTGLHEDARTPAFMCSAAEEEKSKTHNVEGPEGAAAAEHQCSAPEGVAGLAQEAQLLLQRQVRALVVGQGLQVHLYLLDVLPDRLWDYRVVLMQLAAEASQ